MNERIKQLMEQAIETVDDPFPGNPLNEELEKMYIPDCFAEKFAELIVRECAGICDDYGMPDGTSPTAIILSAAIKKRFGIKE